MKTLAIIPARGGSKRIPRKNIKPFLGKPMVTHPIDLVLKAGCFDDVVVSTDDSEIAEVAKAHGAEVPFFRSAETSSDTATTAAVIEEVVGRLEDAGRRYDLLCCVYPTSVLMQEKRLLQARAMALEDEACDGAMPVVPFSFPIQRSLQQVDGYLSWVWPEYAQTRSQDLPPRYQDAGQFYWSKVPSFHRTKQILTPRTRALVLDEWEVQDIDNESDVLMAELKYRLLERQGSVAPA